jgi:hypothetical protein
VCMNVVMGVHRIPWLKGVSTLFCKHSLIRA